MKREARLYLKQTDLSNDCSNHSSHEHGIEGLICIFECEEFLLSPILRSNILYWACTLSESMFDWHDLQQLLEDIQPYPECMNLMMKNRTSLHAAAITGNWKKLKVLIQNINQRYMKKTSNVVIKTGFNLDFQQF